MVRPTSASPVAAHASSKNSLMRRPMYEESWISATRGEAALQQVRGEERGFVLERPDLEMEPALAAGFLGSRVVERGQAGRVGEWPGDDRVVADRPGRGWRAPPRLRARGTRPPRSGRSRRATEDRRRTGARTPPGRGAARRPRPRRSRAAPPTRTRRRRRGPGSRGARRCAAADHSSSQPDVLVPSVQTAATPIEPRRSEPR